MQCKNLVVGGNRQEGFYMHPCGQCVACRINNTRAWYVRSRFELKKLERPFQYFLTLTYNDENLPEDKLCHKEDLKKFLNNLNTSFGLKLRYYACSDYGSINNRAHYHAILLSTKKITSSQVERIWKKGFVLLKELNDNNLRYTLRYTLKKRPIEQGDKAFFRLISKGWGNNVKDYYTGQDYFVFDGKKYGINAYLRQKLGLEKNPVDRTIYYDKLVLSPQFKFKGTFESFIEDKIEYNKRLRRLK